ncbi:hypothetical protein Taro_053822 [Colocasia esculenta]|uniref:Uncharacterized protein n=1 Tax=Colocasia esculenta TaxID=4460 RepID=A0A843XNP4_COLES|nr:hypothetical protein [Colocasia esculenta]
MADQLASRMWTRLTEPPQDVDHVIINMDIFNGPARAEKFEQDFPPATSSDAQVERGHAEATWEGDDDATEEKISKKMPKTIGTEKEEQWIWRVHTSVRQHEKEAYEPKLVSIGPLHLGKTRLLPMDDIKSRYVRHLLNRSPNNNIKNYAKVMRSCEGLARKMYACNKLDRLSKVDFVVMLITDGCFLIEYFLRKFFDETLDTEGLVGVGWGFSHLRRDVLLLENQIPFFVLVKLFDNTHIPNKGTTQDSQPTLMKIVLNFLRFKNIPHYMLPKANEVHHLLHLYYLCMSPAPPRDKPDLREVDSITSRLLRPWNKAIWSPIPLAFYGLLYLLLFYEWRPWRRRRDQPYRQETVPCATELDWAGVKFKRRVSQNHEFDSYLNVSFSEGTLEMPFFPVGQSTSSLLRNCIALEQCRPRLGNHFTGYAIFMHNIITTASDASILRKYGIIESMLGSDKKVAKMFSSLLKGTHLTYRQYYAIDELTKRVKEHCEAPQHRWRAKVVSAFFRSPWAPVTVIAALFGFLISIAQLVLAIARRSS